MSHAVSIARKRRRGFSVYTAQPFDGSGTSLYATAGTAVLYRSLRTVPTRPARGLPPVTKTTRVAFEPDPATSIDWTLPAELASGDVTFDVRRYADDVECQTENAETVVAELDGSLDDVTGILGTAALLAPEIRAGGVVRLRFRWSADSSGSQPTSFTWSRTAGPTSPTAIVVDAVDGQVIYETDTAALSDSSPYTYQLTATDGVVTVTLLTGVVFTADASGPPAPASATAEGW